MQIDISLMDVASVYYDSAETVDWFYQHYDKERLACLGILQWTRK